MADLSCPFNKNHKIKSYDFLAHVKRCKCGLGCSKFSCQFNQYHIFSECNEYIEHFQNCEEKKKNESRLNEFPPIPPIRICPYNRNHEVRLEEYQIHVKNCMEGKKEMNPSIENCTEWDHADDIQTSSNNSNPKGTNNIKNSPNFQNFQNITNIKNITDIKNITLSANSTNIANIANNKNKNDSYSKNNEGSSGKIKNPDLDNKSNLSAVPIVNDIFNTDFNSLTIKTENNAYVYFLFSKKHRLGANELKITTFGFVEDFSIFKRPEMLDEKFLYKFLNNRIIATLHLRSNDEASKTILSHWISNNKIGIIKLEKMNPSSNQDPFLLFINKTFPIFGLLFEDPYALLLLYSQELDQDFQLKNYNFPCEKSSVFSERKGAIPGLRFKEINLLNTFNSFKTSKISKTSKTFNSSKTLNFNNENLQESKGLKNMQNLQGLQDPQDLQGVENLEVVRDLQNLRDVEDLKDLEDLPESNQNLFQIQNLKVQIQALQEENKHQNKINQELLKNQDNQDMKNKLLEMDYKVKKSNLEEDCIKSKKEIEELKKAK